MQLFYSIKKKVSASQQIFPESKEKLHCGFHISIYSQNGCVVEGKLRNNFFAVSKRLDAVFCIEKCGTLKKTKHSLFCVLPVV